MLKTVALSASVLAFASGLAFAETTNTSSSLSTDHWLASDIYKADVYDPSEHKIGKVTDLMIDSNGNVAGAIIGVGGSRRQGLAGPQSHQRRTKEGSRRQ
jgi:sporulation protein YlmC with PRC-barrel domain